MEDRRWKMAKAASGSVSGICDGLHGQFAQENKILRDSSTVNPVDVSNLVGRSPRPRFTAGFPTGFKATGMLGKFGPGRGARQNSSPIKPQRTQRTQRG